MSHVRKATAFPQILLQPPNAPFAFVSNGQVWMDGVLPLNSASVSFVTSIDPFPFLGALPR